MPNEKNSEYYQLLLQRWQQRRCTPSEALELMDYLSLCGAERTLLREMEVAYEQVLPSSGEGDSEVGDRVRNGLLQHIHKQDTPIIPWYRGRLKYAAAVILLAAGTLSAILFVYQQKYSKTSPLPADIAIADIAPGKNKAVLTLANGEKVILDSAGNQLLARQGSSDIKNENGQLVYKPGNGSNEPIYNTLTTSSGETYSISLADGSRVWLNAASSIRFPVAFTGNERTVDVSGEAYFEVKHDSQKPFRIRVSGMEVQVLGTNFNINAYSGEPFVRTTVLEGAVKVHNGQGSVQLGAGEQSQVKDDGSIRKVTGVNTSEIVAWKEGFFQFDNTDIAVVLRQFALWYNVEIIYEGNLKPRKFFGIINRNCSLMNVLKMLSANNVSFRLEGRKLIIQGD